MTQGPRRESSQRVLLIVLALALVGAIAGQYYLAKKIGYMWDGLVLYAVAMACFGWVAVRMEGRARTNGGGLTLTLWAEFRQALRQSSVRLAVLGAGLVLVVFVTAIAAGRAWDKPFWDLLILWLVGIGCGVGAFVDWRGLPDRWRRARAGLVRNAGEWALVLSLTVAAFLLRAVNRGNIPWILAGDEASMGMESVSIIEGRLLNPFVTSWFSNPTLFFFIQAICLRLWGNNATALRLIPAIISSATVPLLYLFARYHWGRWVAFLAAILCTTYHFAIQFGRLGINNVFDPFFALGIFYFTEKGLDRKSLGHILVAALFAGFSFYFHAGGRLVIGILALYLVYRTLSEREFLRQRRTLLIIWGLVALMVVLPLLQFFISHPLDATAPWTRKSIFAMGWVDQQVALGRKLSAILTDQFLKSILAFNYTTDPAPFYRPGIPLLQFIPSLLFVFGIAYALCNWRKRQYFMLLLWFMMVIVFGGMLLENPPSAHRLTSAIPPALLFVTLGLVKLATYVQTLLKGRRVQLLLATLTLTLLMGYGSVRFYFVTYAASHNFADSNTEVADRMGSYLHTLGPTYACYFRGAPRMYADFPNLLFLAPEVPVMDVPQISGDLGFLQPGRNAVIVLLPEYRSELDYVQRQYSGRLREFRDDRGNILFVSYEIDLV